MCVQITYDITRRELLCGDFGGMSGGGGGD